jgi:hypothetical protein
MTRYAALFIVVLLAGCASATNSPATLAGGPQAAFAPMGSIVEAQSRSVAPESCGRKVHFTAHPDGGSFQVPHCAGWSGTIQYPTQPLKSIWNVMSSETNNFGAPPPPNGTAIFYMRMQLLHPAGALFHNEGVDNTIMSPKLTSAHTYTLNGYNFVYNNQCPSSRCTWTLNIGSPQPGSHSITFPSPLNGTEADQGSDVPLIWQFVQN